VNTKDVECCSICRRAIPVDVLLTSIEKKARPITIPPAYRLPLTIWHACPDGDWFITGEE